LRETCEDDGINTAFPLAPLLVSVKDESGVASVVGAGVTATTRWLVPENPVITKFVALFAVVARLANRMISPVRKPAVIGSPAVKVNPVVLSDVTLVKSVFDNDSALDLVPRQAASKKSK
jgi:hypothetical protein